MPFITRDGGLEMEFDTYPNSKYYDPDATTVKLTFQKECNMDPESYDYKEIIRRGDPVTERMYWKQDACYRIPHNRFDTYTLERLLKYYEMEQEQLQGPQSYLPTLDYEPDIEDIIITKYGHNAGWHMPLWLLDALVAKGAFEAALTKGKLNSKFDERMLTKAQYEELMIALQERRELEKTLTKTEDELLEEENAVSTIKARKKVEEARKSTKIRERNRRQKKRELEKELKDEENSEVADKKLEEGLKELVKGGNVS